MSPPASWSVLVAQRFPPSLRFGAARRSALRVGGSAASAGLKACATIACLIALATGCLKRPTENPNLIVVSMTTGPNNFDPRVGTDDASQKVHQLLFDDLMEVDEHLQIVPNLAERLDHPDPLTYIATLRKGVRFHDGHELTSADVVFTFRCMIDPAFISARKTAFRPLASVNALDRYTVIFTLKTPFTSFPASLVIPVVPDGADRLFQDHPIGTGPYRFVRYAVDDRLELAAFPDYFEGPPQNEGVILRIIPDEVMRGLELRKGTIDLVVNDVGPDIVHELEQNRDLTVTSGPGTDYQYIGLNLRDPVLSDVRVRRALAYAIDRDAIVAYLRRGFATAAVGPLPPASWAFRRPSLQATYPHDPAHARALLDEAGHPDPDGAGPKPRLRLSLKVSNVEFNRLQSTVIQQDLQNVGIALDVRMFEFATLYADILSGSFQMYTLQWTGGALADPDILRQIFHSSQTPPNGFNRGYFYDQRVDDLLDKASASADRATRQELFGQVQQVLAEDVPYVSLWYKTNYVISRRNLTGVRLAPTASLYFLKDVARTLAAN